MIVLISFVKRKVQKIQTSDVVCSLVGVVNFDHLPIHNFLLCDFFIVLRPKLDVARFCQCTMTSDWHIPDFMGEFTSARGFVDNYVTLGGGWVG